MAVAAGLAQAVSVAWPFAWGVAAGTPLPWLQVLSLALLVQGMQGASTARVAALRGWWFALAWLAGTFWWLFISMHTYGGLPAALAVAAVLALAGALGGYYAVAAAVFWRWRGAGPVAQALAFAAVWTLAEWARGTWLTGFPWGASGYAHVDALGWLAPYLGVYGMGAVAALLAAAWAWPWRHCRWRGWAWRLLWLPVLVWPAAGSWLVQHAPSHTRSSGTLPVTLLQGNIPQDEKFQPATGVALALDWYGEQIRQALAGLEAAPSLVVAPETAIPLLPQDMDPAYWTRLLQAVGQSRSALLLGLPLGNWDDGFTNSVAGWTPALAMYRYDKHHLVPFGEFIPPLFRWFTRLMNIPLGDFNRGALGQPPLAWAGQRVLPNICYEDVFGEELARAFVDPATEPTLLVNVSNIAWFGDSVAIDQHRHMSRLRALELERPMLRATNTGATAVIDHRGRVVAELPRLTRAALNATVEGREGLTPYARWVGALGLWPLVGLCLLTLAGLWRFRWRERG